MKNFLLRVEKKRFACTSIIFVFLFVTWISKVWLKNIYIFEWVMHNKYLYICFALALILILFNKVYSAYGITFGSTIGLFIGQLLGDIILAINEKKLTLDAYANSSWSLTLHYGAFIWLCSILFFFIIGILLDWWKTRKMGQQKNVQ